MDPSTHAHLGIIDAYLAGRLSVEDAARQIVAIKAPPINMQFGPRLRPLLAELHRIHTGRTPPAIPPYAPNPNRHAGGGLQLLANHSAETWASINRPPLRNLELRLDCSINATTQATAERLVQWFAAQGAYRVDLRSPAEADSDDWRVTVTTQPRHWDLSGIEEWEALLRRAPLDSDASYCAFGVSRA